MKQSEYVWLAMYWPVLSALTSTKRATVQIFDFLKKRKQNELGKCNHFVIECVIVTSFGLSEILGNFIGIYNVHTCNFFGLGIALLCVILEGVFLFKE